MIYIKDSVRSWDDTFGVVGKVSFMEMSNKLCIANIYMIDDKLSRKYFDMEALGDKEPIETKAFMSKREMNYYIHFFNRKPDDKNSKIMDFYFRNEDDVEEAFEILSSGKYD
jgi:hypothetical protein